MSGKKIRTVLGDIHPDDLGTTLSHEHLAVRFEVGEKTWVGAHTSGNDLAHLPLTMENLWWIRRNPCSHVENMRLHEEPDAVLAEIQFYYKNGGRAIVETTTSDIGRDMTYMKRVSEETAVHVVAGTGFYLEPSHPAAVANMSIEQLAGMFIEDIMTGADGTDIKCGVIGEVGVSWPMTAQERKVIEAAAVAQSQLACPLTVHTARGSQSPFELARIIQEAGGDISKTVMDHIDRTLHDYGELVELASLGAYCEFDLFGNECSHYDLGAEIDMPSDAERIKRIKHLIDAGHEDKVLIGHDLHSKHGLMKYGGHGYSHILMNIVPKMRQRGISDASIDKLLVSNPREWLQFTP